MCAALRTVPSGFGVNRNGRATEELKQTGEKAGFGGHSGSVVGIGKEDALFSGKAQRELTNMGDRASERGNPCSVDQRQRDHFDEDSGVVGMANVTEWPAGDDAQLR